MHTPFTRTKMRAIPLILLSTFAASAAVAETELGKTVVTANRYATDIDQLTTTVTSVTREQMDRRLPADEADLFRDDPDVVMARDLRRHGATRVNIRGIDDNRVVQTIDGVRMADWYTGGGPTNYTTAAAVGVMPDFLRQVEIVRGPASSLYGSDALGGVVGYLTLNPEDIAKGDAKTGVRLRGSLGSVNDGVSGSVVGALRGDTIDVLLGYAQSHSSEFDNKGDSDVFGARRSTPNHLSTDDQSGIAKFIIRPATGHKLIAMVEGRKQETTSDILRTPYVKVAAMQGDDESKRVRGSLEYEHTPVGAFYDRLTARLFHQESENYNANYQRRANTSSSCSASSGSGNNCDMYQDFKLEQKQTGLGLQLESAFDIAGVGNLLTYGIDVARQEVETRRDGTVINRTAGTVSKNISGENYPLRDFPKGRTDTVGIFAQNEISLFDNRLTVTPGVRYDYTHLEPELDALSQGVLTALGRRAVEQSYNHLSPKLGLQWKFTQAVAAYGQIASGFRAPNYNEVNGSFRNTTQGYAIVPNADLKPETSVGVELGMRLNTATGRAQLAVYDNRYRDFIEQVSLTSTDPAFVSGLFGTYQNRNLSRVRIYGAELRGVMNLTSNWRIDGALAYAKGENTETGKPLNSIEPVRASVGLAYDTGTWGAESRIRAATRKSEVDDTGGTWFRTPGYAVADLATWIKPTRNTQIVFAVNNLFDQKYWLWSDIRQADARNPVAPEFYSQPGRNYRISFQADF